MRHTFAMTERDPGADPEPVEPAEPVDSDAPIETHRLGDPARRAIDIIRSGVSGAREPIADRVSQARSDVERTWTDGPLSRARRIRRLASQPLPFIDDVHPAARKARPVEVGLRTIDIADIAGTAVGGGAQRGGDFLPLKPFRGANWLGRWQRLRTAQEGLAVLPPIDVEKFGDRYWVVDGHNRVALALYGGQVAIDANVVELVPMGERRTEPIGTLGPSAAASRAVRTAGMGQQPSQALADEDAVSIEPPDDGG
jgi:hypothetical protein